jgi:hypothetical protein
MVAISWEDMGPPVEISPGLVMFEYGTTVMRNYKGYDLRARVVYDGRRFHVDELTVSRRDGGPPVTGEALREIAVQAIVRDALKTSNALYIGRDIPVGTKISALGMIETAEAERLREAGPVRETLEWVARVYLSAEAIGERPTKAVRQTFGISQTTAGAWIGRARAAGLIAEVDRP